jgi:two-component system nitrogen regulation response regulator GlnG
MASGREVHVNDLPPEMLQSSSLAVAAVGGEWQDTLRRWADQELGLGKVGLLDTAVPVFERIMIETALKHTSGRRRDAAVLLGWGRNTLTRKIKELGMGDGEDGEED